MNRRVFIAVSFVAVSAHRLPFLGSSGAVLIILADLRCPLMTYRLASLEVGAAALDERRMPATCYGASTVG